MLPIIERHARIVFCDLDAEAREEAVQEVIANALVTFVRLYELDKVDLAYPTVLARYGVARVRCGRRVGGRLNVNEVLSRYAQRRKGFTVSRLDRQKCNEWQEVLVEDKKSTPADIATVRIDFAAWLSKMSPSRRQLAKDLACGESTADVAKSRAVTPARISQIRKEFQGSWSAFQGEAVGV